MLLVGLLISIGGIIVVGGFYCGFVLGSGARVDATKQTRLRSIDSERQMYELTRQAFVAMTEAAEQAQNHRAHSHHHPEIS